MNAQRNFAIEKAQLTVVYRGGILQELEGLLPGGAVSPRQVVDARYEYEIARLELEELIARDNEA